MINFEYLIKAGLTESDYLLMVKVFQKDFYLIDLEKEQVNIDRLLEDGYFALLKTGKTLFDKLRLSQKGKAFLDNILEPVISDEVIHLEKELRRIYEDNNKIVGDNITKKLAWFKDATGFRNNVIIEAVEEHLTMDSFTYSLSNLIWKGQNVFAVKYDLGGSYLFETIKKKFGYDTLIFTDKRDKLTHFLFTFGKTLPPKGLDKSMYFSGDYNTDCEHITKLAKLLTTKLTKLKE